MNDVPRRATKICVVADSEPMEVFARMMRLEQPAEYYGSLSFELRASIGAMEKVVLREWSAERFRSWICEQVLATIKLTAQQEWDKEFGTECDRGMATLHDNLRQLRWKAFTESEWYACEMTARDWYQPLRSEAADQAAELLHATLFDERVGCASLWYKLEYARATLLLPLYKEHIQFPNRQPISVHTAAVCAPLPDKFADGTLPLVWREKFLFQSITALRSDERLPEMFLLVQPIEELDSLGKMVTEFNVLARKIITQRQQTLWGVRPRFPALLLLTSTRWPASEFNSAGRRDALRAQALRILHELAMDAISICPEIEVLEYCGAGATHLIEAFKNNLQAIQPGCWKPVPSRFDAAQDREWKQMVVLRLKAASDVEPAPAQPADPTITAGCAVVMDVPNCAVDEQPAAPAPPVLRKTPLTDDAPAPPKDEPNECVVCLDAKRTRASVQCGHLVLCANCSVDKCPICNARVQTWLTIYNP